jgi:RNA polymerase sigma-70 factor (ECF subfamily)
MQYDLDASVHEIRPSLFEVFYAEAWLEVYRPLAATLGDRELAREAVDEAMARAFAHWTRVRKLGNAKGWVYRVAYHWAIDRIRKRNTERRIIPRLAHSSVGDAPVVTPELSGALASLPVGQRAVVVLACVFDWPQREIAHVLGIQVGTVKSRLHRGLERLREELGQ